MNDGISSRLCFHIHRRGGGSQQRKEEVLTLNFVSIIEELLPEAFLQKGGKNTKDETS